MEGYTNVCEATSQSLDMESYRPTHRKGKKLLAEKKRRARINNCLMQIRDIVCHGEESKDTDIDKMEKAEILEKTLEVLTKLRHDYDSSRNTLTSHKAMAVRYASGFSSCAEESIRYIQCSRLIPGEVKNQLQSHLRSIARRMESSVVTDAPLAYELPHPSTVAPMHTTVSSLPAIQTQEPSTSSYSPHILPLSRNSSNSPQISPRTRLNFQDPPQNTSFTAPAMTTDVKPDSSRIPSPIHSSTPVLHVDDHEMVVIPSVSHGYHHHHHNSQVNFSPITAHDFAQEHKENHPNQNSSYVCVVPSSSPSSQDRKIFSSQGNSAFYKCTPRSLTSASSPPKHDQDALIYSQNQHSSSFISSSSPSSSSSLSKVKVQQHQHSLSQYSPVSPATSPVHTMCSMSLSAPPPLPSTPKHQIYQYHGYEPYPVLPIVTSSVVLSETSPQQQQSSSLNLSQSTPSTTSGSALDLCIKRNESHNISPETMWRPW